MPDLLTILWVTILVLGILVIFYFSPFFISPILKRVLSLWESWLGRRKRKVLLSYAPTKGQLEPDDLEKLNTKLKLEAENEFAMLEDRVKAEEDLLQQELEELRKRIQNLEEKSEKRKSEIKNDLVAKAFDKTKEQFNKDTGKNILLLIVIAAILLFDTIIARQIFKSFGLGAEILNIGERHIEYAWIFGIFVTIISALVLHIFWASENFKLLLKSRWSFVLGGAFVAAIFVIRLVTFGVSPDYAKSLADSLLIICWLAGVFIVYWFLSEITGEDRNWFKALVALCAPLLLVLFFIFGGVLLLHFIFHWGAEHVIKSWLGLRAARKQQMIHNDEIQKNAQRAAFYRGLTT